MTSTSYCFFFFNDTATTEIYTLSLHDALPILAIWVFRWGFTSNGYFQKIKSSGRKIVKSVPGQMEIASGSRSEEHTSELQSQSNLVCRLLLEKKKET